MISILQNIYGATFNSCWLCLGNILFCFSKHSFCSQPTIQRSRCTPSCGNMWEAQSHDQPPSGIFEYQQEFFIFLATSWQTPSFFIHYWNRAENIRQSWKLRQKTAHRKSQTLRNWYFISWVLISTLKWSHFIVIVAAAIFIVVW